MKDFLKKASQSIKEKEHYQKIIKRHRRIVKARREQMLSIEKHLPEAKRVPETERRISRTKKHFDCLIKAYDEAIEKTIKYKTQNNLLDNDQIIDPFVSLCI